MDYCWLAQRGSIKDKSLIEAESNSNSNDDAVSSGQLSYHIAEVLPSNQVLLNANAVLGRNLNELKYGASHLNHT